MMVKSKCWSGGVVCLLHDDALCLSDKELACWYREEVPWSEESVENFHRHFNQVLSCYGS